MATAVDDTRHSVLRQAHPVSQTELDLFAHGADNRRRRFLTPRTGTYDVQELDVKTALTLCAMPSQPWSLNPYMGCSHDCIYCYVPDVARVERQRWGSYVVIKRNLPNVLADELRRKERRPVFLSSATDPYQPVEGTREITRRCLELLLRADWPVRVLTRNPLVLRDLDLLTRFSDVQVGMSVPTFDDAARRALEPGAPTIRARLATLRALSEAGLRPFVNIAPAYPFTGGVTPKTIAADLHEAGVDKVHVLPWRYMEGVMPFLRLRCQGTPFEALPAHVTSRPYYERMFRSLKAAIEAKGIRFHGLSTWMRIPER